MTTLYISVLFFYKIEVIILTIIISKDVTENKNVSSLST